MPKREIQEASLQNRASCVAQHTTNEKNDKAPGKRVLQVFAIAVGSHTFKSFSGAMVGVGIQALPIFAPLGLALIAVGGALFLSSLVISLALQNEASPTTNRMIISHVKNSLISFAVGVALGFAYPQFVIQPAAMTITSCIIATTMVAIDYYHHPADPDPPGA